MADDDCSFRLCHVHSIKIFPLWKEFVHSLNQPQLQQVFISSSRWVYGATCFIQAMEKGQMVNTVRWQKGERPCPFLSLTNVYLLPPPRYTLLTQLKYKPLNKGF